MLFSVLIEAIRSPIALYTPHHFITLTKSLPLQLHCTIAAPTPRYNPRILCTLSKIHLQTARY
ncbi:hypothetical protein E2C01_075515 [Portunus trituberculatus]|uniref:Uncharacterized protein n=1 Tax=Portunus trituberculatus TaxID=210409 RepID=A0A5B7IJC5_PORTR|nr:hypothetical protein [Portunus trituberculatus]